MKNKLVYFSITLIALLFLNSCEKDTEGVSGEFYLEIIGGATQILPIGTPYVEPGAKSLYRGVDVTDKLVITGSVDETTVGIYPINYAYTNSDGVKTEKKKTVIVCDPTIETDIQGNYITVDGTHRLSGTTVTNYPNFKVTITKIAPGFFQVSDWLGGYYDQRAKYGVAYACNGYVRLMADNSIVKLTSSILPWGDTLTDVTGGSYDPETGTIKWSAEYANMFFNVVLNLDK